MKLNEDTSRLRKSLEVLRDWTWDDDWYSSLSFDMALNSNFELWATERIEQGKNLIANNQGLASFILKLRDETISELEKAVEYSDVTQRWYFMRSAYAKYGFVETVVEASKVSDSVIARLEKDLGDDYLLTLTQIDRVEPSVLTSFDNLDAHISADILLLKSVQDYLVLKHWQDSQNQFHNDVIFPHFKAARIAFESFWVEQYTKLGSFSARDGLAIQLLLNEKLVPVSLLSSLCLIGLGEKLTRVFGGKAIGLAKLIALQKPVPLTFCIPVNVEISENLFTKLPNQENWAVRSSATVEDGTNQSFAGMFESVLNVEHAQLVQATKQVIDSVNSARTKAYVEKFKTEQPKMAVVIQQFNEPDFAGVWMGNSLASGTLEWVSGNGEKLVSGKVRPESETWPSQEQGITPSKESEPVGKRCLDLQAKLAVPADLEWCIVNGSLIWLQFRPVTSSVAVSPKPTSALQEDELRGTAASPGKVTGTAIVLEDPKESIWKANSILVTEYTDPDWVPIMISAAAIVTEQGGMLCHTAIIARELGIPCIVGVQGALQISDQSSIEVDGSKGIVRKA
ncbi:MAG: PEP-utilizing enzyme [Patescibacteria group bacterium]|nr:PEP-utilizing enzyme [Patescibacteria group bacterium]